MATSKERIQAEIDRFEVEHDEEDDEIFEGTEESGYLRGLKFALAQVPTARDLAVFTAGFHWSYRGNQAHAPERLCRAISSTFNIEFDWEEAERLLVDSILI